jgi:hypothetical protein
VDEVRQEVIGGVCPPLGDQPLHPLAHHVARPQRNVELVERRSRVEGGDRRSDHRLELVPVGLRHAEHLADDGDRQGERQIADHVDRALEAVEDLVGEAHDVGPEALDGPGRERLGHQPAHPGVVGRVEEQQGAPVAGVAGEALVPFRLGQTMALPGARRALPKRGSRSTHSQSV